MYVDLESVLLWMFSIEAPRFHIQKVLLAYEEIHYMRLYASELKMIPRPFYAHPRCSILNASSEERIRSTRLQGETALYGAAMRSTRELIRSLDEMDDDIFFGIDAELMGLRDIGVGGAVSMV